ncbi:MAG: UDP-N-acetylglucosamine 2-epimerase [bacterium]|nr:UDP-N-acetylglucosamine 2-epimerase [bacterium]MDY4099823.1 UDP-N-acetylglucosamine 2-epimerase [Lachnospiraceae bacterium]
MKKIAIVTATRAEYGILYPLIKRLLACEQWDTRVVVTGTHLDEAFGYTCKEIARDGVPIDRKIPITEKGDDAYAVSCMMANALRGFGAYFQEEKPDLLILLGDRTEMLAIASAAMNARIPIAHLHGGELTQGAVDECVRHAITKMSYLHFAAAEEYRKRIIRMGEDPSRVFNVGALGVENILSEELLSRQELKEAVDLPADRDYAVVTFHPVTLEDETAENQVCELLVAMKQRRDLFFLITKANSDAGGRRINELLEKETAGCPNMKLVASLGMKRYLSAVKYAKFVLGNSSSGIIEAPAMQTPTVNIGDRQQGRIMAESIINCAPERSSILAAIDRAMDMQGLVVENPYGDGHTSEKIVAILEKYMSLDHINLKKKFYDHPEG